MTDLIPGGLLSDSERERLGALEDTIRRGLQSFMEAGQALTEVRDSRLYRDGYATFEDYCRDRWSISRPRAYELIAGAEAVSGIPDTMPKPINAGQAVELARVPMEHRVEVWGKAVEQTDGKPTAAAVRDARDRIAPRPAAPAPPQPPAPRPGSASNRPLAEPSQPATVPSAPEYSEPSMFDDGIVDAEIVDPPSRADAPFAPSGPSRVSDSDRAALNAFVGSDPAIRLAAWRTSFMTAIGRMASITEFKPDDVAVKADQQLIDELQAAHRHLGNYIDRINAQRPSGLRLVQKG